ncbi:MULTISPECIES: helix-turn-helix domain-containing protein [unclassified Myroides]|uniref:helix-turn-helix domain-containing protein n=1 Tax=unclassified Myroides TaxID=2642485 RepID=UPI0025773810|nr:MULTISPECIES: helix-turn-helix domain-containing protein [unclassified Myroides]
MNSNYLQTSFSINSSKKILTKLKILLGVKSAKELAVIFDLKPNTISSWKKRNTLCYSKLIQVCCEHNIDLNELFFSNYTKKTIEKSYINVPIIYIDDYLEYYLSIEEKHLKLKQIYYPKPVFFDMVIQLYATIEEHKGSHLVYAFCKKVDFTTIEIGKNYVLLFVNKGFQCYKIIEVNQQKERLYLQKDTAEIVEVPMKEILEIFRWIKYLPC